MNKEPALIIGAVEAGLVLAIAFGAPITESEKGAVIGFASAVLALVAAFTTRQLVTPKARAAGRRR